MYGEATDVVGVCLERGDLFMCVVVEGAQVEIIRASNEPLFPRDKVDASYRNLGHFESLDESARFGIVDVYDAVV